MVVREPRPGADHVRRAGQRGELAAAGDVVVVEVRLDDVADAEVALARGIEVDVDVAARIDDRGEAGRLVGDERGEVAETVDHELSDQHPGEGTPTTAAPGGTHLRRVRTGLDGRLRPTPRRGRGALDAICCRECGRGPADPRAWWRRLSGMADGDGILEGGTPCRRHRQLCQAPVGARAGRSPAVPHPDPPRTSPRLARGHRERDRAARRRPDRLRLRRERHRRLPARHDRPLRRAAVRPVLDDRRPPRDVHPGEQRRRQPQRPVRDPRPLARDAPRQARDDGRVRDARHRHRRGLPHGRPQRPRAHVPLPQDAGVDVPPLEGPRLAQHPLRDADLGPPGDRPQPGRRVRHRDRRVGARSAARDELPLRRGLRDRAQPVLRPGRDRPPAERLRQGRTDARLPQHPRHDPVRLARRRQPRGAGRAARLQPVHRAVQRARAGRAGAGRRRGARLDRRDRARDRTRARSSRTTTTTRSTPSCSTSACSRACSTRS